MALDELNAEYERIRTWEREALEKRAAHACALNPGFAELERKRRAVTDALSDALYGGMDAREAASAAREKLAAFMEDERALLQESGLPEDYLMLHVRCKKCGDTGYVGEPLRVRCTCLQKALMERKRASSHIDASETFEQFNPAIFRDEAQWKQMKSAGKFLEEYAEYLPHTQARNILLMGMAGLGKSFLLNCVADRVLERGYGVIKITAYNLQENILEGIRNNADGTRAFLTVPLLLIDDLGTEPMLNNITREYLFSIFNERRNGKLHTVVATNLSLEQLQAQYGERICSRIMSTDNGRVLKLTGENLRLRKGK